MVAPPEGAGEVETVLGLGVAGLVGAGLVGAGLVGDGARAWVGNGVMTGVGVGLAGVTDSVIGVAPWGVGD
jgi:hypothetical protein